MLSHYDDELFSERARERQEKNEGDRRRRRRQTLRRLFYSEWETLRDANATSYFAEHSDRKEKNGEGMLDNFRTTPTTKVSLRALDTVRIA
jgi:hypothetical protein